MIYCRIITKHWISLTDIQLLELAKYNVCINTSISALDPINLIQKGLKEYERIKPYCKSVLRVVSADFNIKSPKGEKLHLLQKSLFKKYNVLDTILRVSPKNELYLNGIINMKGTKFMGKKCYISKFNKKTFFGKCENCIELCGIKQ